MIPWRSFNELSNDEKRSMLLHFKRRQYFWGYNLSSQRDFMGDSFEKVSSVEDGITYAINSMNTLYKKECYAKQTLEHWTFQNVYEDFKNIFLNRDENVVYELISLYGMGLVTKSEERKPNRNQGESDDDYEKRKIEAAFDQFDQFQDVLNDIFEDYKVNMQLTRFGFVPRQDKQIIEDIYLPVLKVLSLLKWKKVNRDLKDAFEAYGKSTPDGYSECMTHCYTAVQALLQELVGDTSLSIKNANQEAAKRGLVPNDAFSSSAFKEILSTFEQLRMKHGDAHPKEEYANEKSAKIMLNLTMVYLQHCLSN